MLDRQNKINFGGANNKIKKFLYFGFKFFPFWRFLNLGEANVKICTQNTKFADPIKQVVFMVHLYWYLYFIINNYYHCEQPIQTLSCLVYST